MVDEQLKELVDQAYGQVKQEHELNCKVMDDHQAHLKKAYELIMPAKIQEFALRVLERAAEPTTNWDLGDHVKDDDAGGTPSAQGRSSLARRLLGLLAAAAVIAALGYGAAKLLEPDPAPPGSPPQKSSLLQYLEDNEFNVPPINE